MKLVVCIQHSHPATIMRAFLLLAAFILPVIHGARRDNWFFIEDSNGKLHFAYLGNGKPTNVPKANPETDINFFLWTNQNPNNHQNLRPGDNGLLGNSNFNNRNPTKIITHGFTENGLAEVATSIRNEYLNSGSYNIISVDWEVLAREPLYNEAAANTRVVGEYTAALIDFLVSNGANINDFHLIGFSLGAQCSGFAANNVQSGKITRISGLDAAMPLFENGDHLESSDANFVDAIHVNGGKLGFGTSYGHVDFYPNGGRLQPGCGEDLTGSCSHGRSHAYFAESINSNRGFRALKCNSWDAYPNSCGGSELMGDPVPSSARGDYYLETNANPPYAKG